jgi:hypothetical protein
VGVNYVWNAEHAHAVPDARVHDSRDLEEEGQKFVKRPDGIRRMAIKKVDSLDGGGQCIR